MRDLAKALSNIKIFEYDEDFVAVCDERNGMLSFPLGLVYEAIERAIDAEFLLRSTTNTLASYQKNNGLLQFDNEVLRKSYHRVRYALENAEAENAKLRVVVDVARNLPCPIWEHSNPVEDKLWDVFIQALVELDSVK